MNKRLLVGAMVALFVGACGSGTGTVRDDSRQEEVSGGEQALEAGERACGGFTAQACGEDEYCSFAGDEAQACGAGDAQGVCRPRPQACTREFVPVCGCDGVTYGNRCEAWANGTDVAAGGPCESEPSQECPPEDMPGVRFMSHNASQCAAMTWVCDDGEVQFFTVCGCGCMPAEMAPGAGE